MVIILLNLVKSEIVFASVFLKAVDPFYLVSKPGEVKYPTQGVNVVDSTTLREGQL